MITKKVMYYPYNYYKDIEGKLINTDAMPCEFTGITSDLALLDGGDVCVKKYGKLVNSSTFFNMQTGEVSMYDESSNTWKLL